MPALVPQLLALCSLGERGCGTQWQLRQRSIPCTAAQWPGLTALTAQLPLPPSSALTATLPLLPLSAPQIPHYHLEKATEAVKPVMGEVRLVWLVRGRSSFGGAGGRPCQAVSASVLQIALAFSPSAPLTHSNQSTRCTLPLPCRSTTASPSPAPAGSPPTSSSPWSAPSGEHSVSI